MLAVPRNSVLALLSGILLSAGCVTAPDHHYDHEHGSYNRNDATYKEHQRREAYEHCRAAGERDCDDLLR